jgi:hypothetical protein
VARCVHGAIEGGPFPLNFHVRFVEPPVLPYGALPTAELFFNLRGILLTQRLSVE